MSVAIQSEKMTGPPKYFTKDWKAVEISVRRIRDLRLLLLIPGYGQPMIGDELTKNLEMPVNSFDQIAKPEQGRFVEK